MTARCEHTPILSACACGLYAFDDVDRAFGSVTCIGPDMVLGRVRGWGTVVIHEFGWRAQFAAPELLLAFTTLGPLAKRLEAHFEVPVLQVAAVNEAGRVAADQLKQEEDE